MAETTEGRLAALERANVLWRRATFSLMFCIGVLLLGAADAPQKTLTAEAFQLNDSDGNIRASLATTPTATELQINGKNGGKVVTRVDNAGGVAFYLRDRDNQPRAALTVLESGQVAFTLLDRNANERIGLAVQKSGPFIVVQDEAGNPVFSAPQHRPQR